MFPTILTPNMVRSLERLAAGNWLSEFYLAGGTGLALQLGHRKSFDLDFFLKPGHDMPWTIIESSLLSDPAVRIDARSGDQIDCNLYGVKVSLVRYPFPLVAPLVSYGNCEVAAPLEIGLMKAYALGRRATVRDYFDLFVLLQSGQLSLDLIGSYAERKFILAGESCFSLKLFLAQLSYTADVREAETMALLEPQPNVSFETVASFLADRAAEFARAQARGQGGDPDR